MSDRLLALLFIGHPVDEDYADWLRQQLTFAGMDLDGLEIVDGHGEAHGSWGGMTCHARHRDDTDQGPLLITFAPEQFEAAMELPLLNDYELPPPLAAFAAACQALQPNVAIVTSVPLDEAGTDQYAIDLSAELADGPSAELCERPYAALFLGSFDLVMLEDEQPLLAKLRRRDLAGGALFFPSH